MIYEIVLVAGLAILAIFSGAYEIALLLISPSRLGELLEEAKVDTNHPRYSYLRSILAGEESIPDSATMLHAALMGAFVACSWHAWGSFYVKEHGLATLEGALTAVAIIFAVIFIRAIAVMIARSEEEELVLTGAFFANILTLPFVPLAKLARKASTIIARSLGRKTEMSEEERKEEIEDEVIAAVSDGELAGVVEEEQREMIEGIFELKDSDVADIFTPRTDMTSIDAGSTLDEAITLSLEKGFSRLPVHKETRDNVIGIFYVRDALLYWGKTDAERPDLQDILRKPLYVPETKNVPELLKEMRENQTHMAIVLDEYGGTAGLVTIEDVIEEIVGDIQDEYDEEAVTDELKKLNDHTIISEGFVHVSDVNEALDMEIIPEDDDYETLAGFVLDNLGHIPEAGEKFQYKALKVEVVSADERKVGRVKVYRDPAFNEE